MGLLKGRGAPKYQARVRKQRTVVKAVGGEYQPKHDILSDAGVPEGHRELHKELYGEDDGGAGPSTHGGYQGTYECIDGEDDGSSLIPVDVFLKERQDERKVHRQPPVGVFAVYDVSKTLQYVSYSRNIPLSVKSILERVGPESCGFVRNIVFQNIAMQTRQAMEEQLQLWIDEHGSIPPGNGSESEKWSAGFDVDAMTKSEKQVYDDKKNKMVAAMGQRVDGEGSLNMSKLRSAVEEGDWSDVIEDQNAEDGTKTTPFVQAQVHRSIGSEGQTRGVEMTMETVDEALEEVRPFLMADGGNVKVVEVQNGRVLLQLQGACGSCAASSSTMKMGIERCLVAAFGDQLKEVIEIGGGAEKVPPTVESVDAHVDGLRGAIAAYGGSVQVAKVDPPRALIAYVGPKPLAYGLVMALKDTFPELSDIQVVDGETGDPIDFDAY